MSDIKWYVKFYRQLGFKIIPNVLNEIAAKSNSCSTLYRRLPSMVMSNLFAMTTLIWQHKLVGTLNQDTAGIGGHVCNSNTQEAEAGQREGPKPEWSLQLIPDQPELQGELQGLYQTQFSKINKWIKIQQECFHFKHLTFMSGWEVDNNCGSPIWIMKAIYFLRKISALQHEYKWWPMSGIKWLHMCCSVELASERTRQSQGSTNFLSILCTQAPYV